MKTKKIIVTNCQECQFAFEDDGFGKTICDLNNIIFAIYGSALPNKERDYRCPLNSNKYLIIGGKK